MIKLFKEVFGDRGIVSPYTVVFAVMLVYLMLRRSPRLASTGNDAIRPAWPGNLKVALYAAAGAGFMGLLSALAGPYPGMSLSLESSTELLILLVPLGVSYLFTVFLAAIAGLLVAKRRYQHYSHFRPQDIAGATGILVGLLTPILVVPGMYVILWLVYLFF